LLLDGDRTANDLLERAAERLRFAKNSGRNKVSA
jgi:hypothetical protein